MAKITDSVVKSDGSTAASKVVSKGKQRTDGWKNAISGLGTNVDKRVYTNLEAGTILKHHQTSSMYTTDGLMQRIVNAFPDDMTRQWIEVLEDSDMGEDEGQIAVKLRELNAQKAFNTALRWARLMGGSLLYIGAMDGNSPDKPLNIKKVKDVEFLKVFDLGEIQTATSKFQKNSAKSDYGKITKYKIQHSRGGNSREIHASRCIEFNGIEIPASTSGADQEQLYWGTSVIQPAWEYIRDFSGAMGSVSQILYEFVIGKYKLADLDEMLMQGNEAMLQTRMQAIDLTKSMIKAVLLGADEDYTRDSASLSGIPDTIDRFMMMLSGITEIPMTKLFGRSPAGLNATGDSDTRNYYDAVKAKQVNDLTPAISGLINLVSSTMGVQDVPAFKWNPLQQLTEKEEVDTLRVESEVYRTQADADQRYLNEGVLTPEEVYDLRFKSDLGPKEFDDLDFDVDYEEVDPVAEDEKMKDPEKKEEK